MQLKLRNFFTGEIRDEDNLDAFLRYNDHRIRFYIWCERYVGNLGSGDTAISLYVEFDRPVSTRLINRQLFTDPQLTVRVVPQTRCLKYFDDLLEEYRHADIGTNVRLISGPYHKGLQKQQGFRSDLL